MFGRGDTGAACEHPGGGLVGPAVVLLGEQADRAGPCDGAHLGFEQAGEDPEEGRLARAVGTDQPDCRAGADGQVDVVQDVLPTERNADPLGDNL